MKRPADDHEDIRVAKQGKVAEDMGDLFDNVVHVRNPKHIYDHGLADDSGYIAGKAMMVWNFPEKMVLAFEYCDVFEGQEQTHRFDVAFTGECFQFLEQESVTFKPRDQIFLALKGATLDKLQPSNKLNTLPMRLNYCENVAIKYVRHTPSTTRLVDTWKLREMQALRKSDWYDGAEDIVCDAPVPVPKQILPFTTPAVQLVKTTKANLPETASVILSSSDIFGAAESDEVAALKETQEIAKSNKLLKRELKQKRKLEIQSRDDADAAQSGSEFGNISSTGAPSLPPPPAPADIVNVTPQYMSPMSFIRDEDSTSASSSAQKPLQESTFQAGFYSPVGTTYTPLSKIVHKRSYNVIAVVNAVSPPSKTRTGEWRNYFKLVDPSNVITENFCSPEGFLVNCFAKKYEQWLPCVEVGDVVILRTMKSQEYNGNCAGIGYADKLSWAVFSPAKGEVHHGALGDVPREEGLADGFGYQFSPFYNPIESEIRYCLKMSDWWREVVMKREAAIREVQYVGNRGTSMISTRDGPEKRQHRLISEAGPRIPPKGFFNCTVEVLHGWLNDNGVYTLHVTDYTHNREVTACQAKWCPTSLSDLVLNIEMWDSAAEIGRKMKVGEYYTIKNARMIVSRSGFVEGKVSQNNIVRLEEQDAPENPHLQALLVRKKKWADSNAISENKFDHILIGEAIVNKFFESTVEVVHTSPSESDPSHIYVTDYTARHDLPKYPDDWSQGLSGRLVKIALYDMQRDMAKQVSIGSYYRIKMRLKVNISTRELQVSLGGNDRLIHMINPNAANENLTNLLLRKEQWKKEMNQAEKPEDLPVAIISGGEKSSNKVISKHQNRHHTSFKDIEACAKCPNKFRIFAKVVDYYPFSLEDSIFGTCTGCQTILRKNHKACVKCDDVEYDFVKYMYQIYFRVQDEQGDEIMLSLSDDCPLFKDLERAHFRDSPSSFERFLSVLKPLLGNLIHSHEMMEKGVDIIPDTPFLSLMINYWQTDTGNRAYALASYEGILDL